MRVHSFAAGLVLALLAIAPASAQKLKIDEVKDSEVCFGSAGCVKTGMAEGYLADPRQQNTWITEIRSDTGKTVAKVGKGGEIVVISPEAYAKRDPGKKTFTIARFDGKTKPVRTNFVGVAVQSQSSWGDQYVAGKGRLAAIGMTELPSDPAINGQPGPLPSFRANLRGRLIVAGDITGIAPDGTLTDTYSNVGVVQLYGDYNILTFRGGMDHQVTDANLRAVSPRTSAIEVVVPAYVDDEDNYSAETDPNRDYPRVAFVVEHGALGKGQKLYQLLPRYAGEAPPQDFLGVIPLYSWRTRVRGCPYGIAEDACLNSSMGNVAAWAGVWAGANGPEMTLLRFDGEPFDGKRYKFISWAGGFRIDAGVVQELSGETRMVLPVTTGKMPDLVYAPQVFASPDAAIADIRLRGQQNDDAWRREIAEHNARVAAEEAMRVRQREAALEFENRRRAQLAALEAAENATADHVLTLGSDDWRQVCDTALTLQTYYAQTQALAHCRVVAPKVASQSQPVKRDFWSQLGDAIDAWASLSAQNPYTPSAPPPVGVSPDWEFARSMRNIDNTTRAVTDPNWNGAATRASTP
jgi:hypothetical protein